MFSYYGAKTNLVDYYPAPKHDKIIEPFAGTARYSLKYWDRDVLLVDKYEVIIRIWKWLQLCSPKDILGLPKLEKGIDISKLNISDDEKMFLGMNAGISSISPRNKVSPFSAEQNGRKNKMKNIANQLYKIKNWKIIHGDFKDLKNETATYFIDPPYMEGGHAYIENKIDYNYLSEWCKTRNGQVIVCENDKANWLPFNPLKKSRGSNQLHTIETIWTNTPTAYNNIQQSLF